MEEGSSVSRESHETLRRPSSLAATIAYALVFLIPVFFVPSNFAPLQFSKTTLALILTAVLVIVLFYRVLKRGTLVFSWSFLHVVLWLLPLAYFVSAIFSSQPILSFLGYEMNTDTFGFILLAAFLSHMTSLTLSTKGRVFSGFVALLMASWVVLIFQIAQIVFAAPFPFFPDASGNLIGRWNDFGLFAGLIASLILLAGESLPLPRLHSILLAATFFVCLGFMVLVDLPVVWVLFGIGAFIALVLSLARKFFSSTEHDSGIFPGIMPLIGFVVALFFIFFGTGVSNSLQQFLQVDAFEVRPTFQSTMNILNAVYADHPVFGSGPNTFSSSWLLHRSSTIVQTPFWNVSFNFGSGTVLTSAATGGALVAFAWLLFVLTLGYTVLRALFIETHDRQSSVVVSLTALGSMYLLAAHVFYAPSQALTLLFFLFVGLFLASLSGTSLIHMNAVELKKNPRIGTGFILIGIVIVLFAVGSVYGVGRQYASAYYHNKAISVANRGDLDDSVRTLNTAIALSAQDRYYRTAALIELARIDAIVQSNDNSTELQARFQNALTSAVRNANIALQKNPQSFSNMMTRGLVFESVIPLQIEGAVENAVGVYEQARALNPYDPELEWRLARIYASQNDVDTARQLITRSLGKKADYTNAILLLAQLELDEGNLTNAIESVRAAVYFEPQNAVLHYQLGILFLQDESYADAVRSFESALSLTPGFANASFFLAQAYAYLGRFEEAAELIGELSTQNPDNTSLLQFRVALLNGDNPFAEAPVAPESDNDLLE